jgi:DNA-binding transcriptional MerR regulator
MIAAEAQRILGIAAATIRQWARRHRLWPRGLDERGRPLYATCDIVRLATS